MPLYVKAIIFIAISAYLIWLSRKSIGKLRHHGLYRLLAWEALLALVLMNLDFWFDDWLSYRQIASWVLLSVSVYLVTGGTLTLYKSGRPGSSRSDPTLIGVEKTTKLVTTGIYRYIRHPIYASAVIGVWGVVLKNVSVIGMSLAIISLVCLTICARLEEIENIDFFGEAYKDYMGRTWMFIPFLF